MISRALGIVLNQGSKNYSLLKLAKCSIDKLCVKPSSYITVFIIIIRSRGICLCINYHITKEERLSVLLFKNGPCNRLILKPYRLGAVGLGYTYISCAVINNVSIPLAVIMLPIGRLCFKRYNQSAIRYLALRIRTKGYLIAIENGHRVINKFFIVAVVVVIAVAVVIIVAVAVVVIVAVAVVVIVAVSVVVIVAVSVVVVIAVSVVVIVAVAVVVTIVFIITTVGIVVIIIANVVIRTRIIGRFLVIFSRVRIGSLGLDISIFYAWL